MTARVAHIEIERRIRKATRDMLAEQECNGFLSRSPAEQAQVWQGRDSDQVEKNERAGMWLAILLGAFISAGIIVAWFQIGAMFIDWMVRG